MVDQDINKDSPSITLPRMSFELLSMTYNPDFKLTRSLQTPVPTDENNNTFRGVFAAAPYDMEFQLNVVAKNFEDGTKIIEQILPYFTPHFTMSMYVIDEYEPFDISVVLNNTSIEDTYEGGFEERRALIWTLSFTLKGYFFGPRSDNKVIKFVKSNIYDDLTAANNVASVSVLPGLTANNEPTTNPDISVGFNDINYDDNWDYITIIEETSTPE